MAKNEQEIQITCYLSQKSSIPIHASTADNNKEKSKSHEKTWKSKQTEDNVDINNVNIKSLAVSMKCYLFDFNNITMKAEFFQCLKTELVVLLFRKNVPLDLILDCFGKLKIFNKSDSDLVQKEVQ